MNSLHLKKLLYYAKAEEYAVWRSTLSHNQEMMGVVK